MSLKLYDTATREVSEFKPLEAGKVSIYVCGATVQSYPHIGHVRSGINFDILRRWLMKNGYDVTFIRNVTDIDDKILHKAVHEHMPWWALAMKYERIFAEAYAALNVLPPTYEPRATGHITQMIELMQTLIESGAAYAPGNGDVYLEVRKLKRYLTLSRQNLDDLQPAADADETYKKDVRDFALWKAAKPGDPSWPTPWGAGRPGWHLECSAMAYAYLGEKFDIHGGGLDLVFPHHENERAQSNAVIGKEAVDLWVHGEHLLFEGRKMSKSSGNVVLVEDLVAKGLDPLALRLCLLENRYRSQMDLTWSSLQAAHETLNRWRTKMNEWGTSSDVLIDQEIADALSNDIDTPRAILRLREVEKNENENRRALFLFADQVLGLDLARPVAKKVLTEQMQKLLDERSKARLEKRWADSDQLRIELENLGLEIKDTKDGQIWS